jgi:hypothetical protein
MDCNFNQKYDDSKIPETYDEKINEVIGYKLQKSTLRSLKKCAMELASARVHYMDSGSNTPILREIFNIEDKVWDEIHDIKKRSGL